MDKGTKQPPLHGSHNATAVALPLPVTRHCIATKRCEGGTPPVTNPSSPHQLRLNPTKSGHKKNSFFYAQPILRPPASGFRPPLPCRPVEPSNLRTRSPRESNQNAQFHAIYNQRLAKSVKPSQTRSNHILFRSLTPRPSPFNPLGINVCQPIPAPAASIPPRSPLNPSSLHIITSRCVDFYVASFLRLSLFSLQRFDSR